MLRMKPGPNQNCFSAPEDLAHLQLMHLADSALPIGALAHSFGLESLTSAEILTNRNLESFLRAYIQEAGLLETVFCREAFRLFELAGSPAAAAATVPPP